jgi:hypothetical protein
MFRGWRLTIVTAHGWKPSVAGARLASRGTIREERPFHAAKIAGPPAEIRYCTALCEVPW